MKPVLRFSNSRLRPSTGMDFAALRDLLWDEQVRRYLCDDTILPEPDIAARLAWSDELGARGLGLWMIEDLRGIFQGIAGLRPIRPEFTTVPGLAGEIELTIAIHPKAWGDGLARAAATRLLRHGFEDLGLRRIIAIVDDPNSRSHTLIKRLGFKAFATDTGPAYTQTVYQMGPSDLPDV